LARRWVLATCGPLARRGGDGRYGGGGRVPSADAARQQPASPPHSPFWRHRGIGGVGGEGPGRAAAGPIHPAHGPAYRAPCSRGTRSLAAHVQRPALPRRVLHVHWLPTVPLLTFVFLVMNAPAAETVLLNRKPGTASSTMVPMGYPGEVQIGTDWCGIPPFDLTGGTRAIGPVLDLAARRDAQVWRGRRLPWAREAGPPAHRRRGPRNRRDGVKKRRWPASPGQLPPAWKPWEAGTLPF
jgi:hypothetical protein